MFPQLGKFTTVHLQLYGHEAGVLVFVLIAQTTHCCISAAGITNHVRHREEMFPKSDTIVSDK